MARRGSPHAIGCLAMMSSHCTADRIGIICRAVLAAACVAFAVVAGLAQEASRPAPDRQSEQTQQQPGSDTATTRAFEPGFLDALGRWFSSSAAGVDAGLKGTRDTLSNLGGHAGEAAKGAADAATGAAKGAADVAIGAVGEVAKLSATRVVDGRERCAPAANGAPDCRRAAENICRANGFTTGRSLDIQSAQKCPARVWLSGRLPAEGECPAETVVTRAVCQ